MENEERGSFTAPAEVEKKVQSEEKAEAAAEPAIPENEKGKADEAIKREGEGEKASEKDQGSDSGALPQPEAG